MKTKESSRKWMWWFLGAGAAFQLYFVRELLAAFALFAFAFAAIAALIASLYMLQKGWEAGVARVAASENSLVLAMRRGVSAVEDLTLQPFRRRNSQLAR